MILDKFIEVTIINHNFHHYKNLGYDVKCREKILDIYLLSIFK